MIIEAVERKSNIKEKNQVDLEIFHSDTQNKME